MTFCLLMTLQKKQTKKNDKKNAKKNQQKKPKRHATERQLKYTSQHHDLSAKVKYRANLLK